MTSQLDQNAFIEPCHNEFEFGDVKIQQRDYGDIGYEALYCYTTVVP